MNDLAVQMITVNSLILLTVMFFLVSRLNRRIRFLEDVLIDAVRASKKKE